MIDLFKYKIIKYAIKNNLNSIQTTNILQKFYKKKTKFFIEILEQLIYKNFW